MKTTIYDLLGMIKDGNAPKKIKVTGTTYEYDEESKSYFAHFKDYSVALGGKEDDINLIYNAFNENVEILNEEEKIEKIDMFDYFTGYWCKELPKDFLQHLENNFGILNSIINELIDEVNKLKESDK